MFKGPVGWTANKLQTVGVSLADEAEWQEALMGFNAALGMQLRGDLHMVVIDADLVDDDVQYANSLKAYWLSDQLDRWQAAKNSIIVVLGVRDGAVEWARADTGMPFGNNGMINALEIRLIGQQLDPDALLGDPVTHVDTTGEQWQTTVELSTPRGVMEQIIFEQHVFARACMECSDDDEASESGFVSLASELEPSTTAKVVAGILSFILGLVLVAIFYNNQFFEPLHNTWNNRRYR